MNPTNEPAQMDLALPVMQPALNAVANPAVMTISVKIKDVYGNRVFYPICPKAELFATIAHTRTLTAATIAHIRALGYTVVVRPDIEI